MVIPAATAPLAGMTPFLSTDQYAELPPHPLAEKVYGGPVSVLFIGTPVSSGRLMAELSASMDGDFEAFYTASRKTFRSETIVASGHDPAAALRSLLDSPRNVYWLDCDIAIFPDDIRDTIMGHVRAGAGLIYTGNADDLDDLSGRGDVKYNMLETMEYRDVSAEFAGLAGRGRLVHLPILEGLKDPVSRTDYFTVAVNALIFATGREMPCYLKPFRLGKKFEVESIAYMRFRIELANSGDKLKTELRVRYRDIDGNFAFEETVAYNVNPGKSFIQLEHPSLMRGRYSLEITLMAENGVYAMAGGSLELDSEQRITEINSISQNIEAEGVIAGNIRLSEDFKEIFTLDSDMLDSCGRILSRQRLKTPKNRLSAPYSYILKNPHDTVMKIRGLFLKSEELVDGYGRYFPVFGVCDPARFSFVGDISSQHVIVDKRSVDILRADGVSAFAIDTSELIAKGDVMNKAAILAMSGSEIVPVIDSDALAKVYASEDRNIDLSENAVVDTLMSFHPPLIVLKGAGVFSDKNSVMLADFFTGSSIGADFGFVAFGESQMLPSDTASNPETQVLQPVDVDGSADGAPVFAVVRNSWKRDKSVLFFRTLPWYALCEGFDGLWWERATDVGEQMLTPSLTPSPVLGILSGEVNTIRSGIDLLLYEAERVDENLFSVPETSGLKSYHFRNGAVDFAIVLSVPDEKDVDTLVSPSVLSISDPRGDMPLYDLRENAFIGAVSSVAIDKPVTVVARYPYRVRNISLSTGSAVLKPGDVLDYSVRVRTDKLNVPLENHVVTVKVYDPDGVDMSFLGGSFLAPFGVFESDIRIAFNDKPGKWRLVVGDLASGKTVERTFIVSGTPGDTQSLR